MGGGERWAAGGAAKPAVATQRDGSGQTYSTTSNASCASATGYAVHLARATHYATGQMVFAAEWHRSGWHCCREAVTNGGRQDTADGRAAAGGGGGPAGGAGGRGP